MALFLAGLVILPLAFRVISHQRGSPVQSNMVAGEPGTNGGLFGVTKAVEAAASPILRLRLEDVLATVNGHKISVRDAVPHSGTNQEVEISSRELKFFLNRAVDRELIFEAAQKQQISLDESQNQQLANLQSARNQSEPGVIAKLNDDAAGRELEALDAKAFMLQTALMAARGASPNVTEDQVQAYYQQHQSEFDSLPADPNTRRQAWQQLAFQIRTRLAGSTRTAYNIGLAAYMQQMESGADVVYATSTP
jgi:hypothetical protein